jgi:hypothetical protein
VLDFSRVLAGPYATMMLGDFGADVIKIERPQVGDDTREWGPPYDSDGVATYFNAVNRNTRSVVLDRTDPDDQARARELTATADVVVENFRAGTMEKFGLDCETVRAFKPDLIYCSFTGSAARDCMHLPASWPRWPTASEPDKASGSTPTCSRCCCHHWSISDCCWASEIGANWNF